MQVIKNKKMEVEASRELNEEDILNDILSHEKCISNDYSIALNEMSNKVLYNKILNLMIESKNMARDLYNLLFERGWYTIQIANEGDITKAYDDANNKKDQLG